MARSERTVPIVVYDGVKLLDVAGPMQVFADATLADGRRAYRTFLISARADGVLTDAGVHLPTARFEGLKRRAIDTLLIAGGDSAETASMDRALVNQVRTLAGRARRVGSICSGAFILAETGLLAGRRAVTHWDSCDRLQAAYPDITVEVDPIFINDGGMWTSAGVTSGIDLALAMVAEDLGRATALSLAKGFVMPMVRAGGQAQFSAMLDAQSADTSGRFEALHAWMAENLQTDLRVERLAEHMHMSPRTFTRLYVKHTSRTPAKAVEAIRVDAARALLEGTDQPIATVAAASGFGDEERMRRAFLRALKVPPSDYRSRFHVPSAPPAIAGSQR